MEYGKRSRLVRTKGCSNPLRGDLPEVSQKPPKAPGCLSPLLLPRGQDNHACVYCPQNHLLVAHIDSILQVQNHSAVSFLLVALGEGANVSGVIAQGILTICGDYLLLCFKVDEVYCQAGEQLCFVGIDPQNFRLPSLYWSQTTSARLACCS